MPKAYYFLASRSIIIFGFYSTGFSYYYSFIYVESAFQISYIDYFYSYVNFISSFGNYFHMLVSTYSNGFILSIKKLLSFVSGILISSLFGNCIPEGYGIPLIGSYLEFMLPGGRGGKFPLILLGGGSFTPFIGGGGRTLLPGFGI